MVSKPNFAKFIKEKRAAALLTQEQLAARLCVSATAVSKWERGVTYPDITMITHICEALGISEREFITACDDIYFSQGGHKFSYRAQGLLLRDGHILLQTDVRGDSEYALPGAQVRFGETAAEALARRFRDETGTAIAVDGFAWAEENFFSWAGENFQQLALTFHAHPVGALPPDSFPGKEETAPHLRFHWVPLERLDAITVYPRNLSELLRGDVRHMIEAIAPH